MLKAMIFGCAAAALAATAAVAAPRSFSFSVPITGGPLAGQTLGGAFTLDLASEGPGTQQYNNLGGLDVDAFSFTLNGVEFTEATADATFIRFVDGVLTRFTFGGDVNGTGLLSPNGLDFILADFGLTYRLGAGPLAFGQGRPVTFVETFDVPAPAAFAFLALGVAGLAMRRRP